MDDRLSIVEMREFLKQLTTLVKGGILNRDDRDRILYICLGACDRELAKIKEENTDGDGAEAYREEGGTCTDRVQDTAEGFSAG